MAFPDEAARDAHRQAGYTERFVQALYPLCEQPPCFTDLVPVYIREP